MCVFYTATCVDVFSVKNSDNLTTLLKLCLALSMRNKENQDQMLGSQSMMIFVVTWLWNAVSLCAGLSRDNQII